MNGSQLTAWRPQLGPQKALIDCPFAEILFGGARGGGKTDGVLGKFGLKEARYGAGFNGVFFRQEMPQADDLIERAKEIYLPTGAEWREQSKTFLLPHGGRLRFRPLESTADAQKYQGQNLSDAAVEEAGNYVNSKPIDMLFGALRSKAGVPIQLVLTANPGGPGHQWLKARYIDPAPLGRHPIRRQMPTGKMSHQYIYIPSRVRDNRVLLANDPTYVDRLALTGSAELVRAWLDGDWNVIAGAYFPEFSLDRHVIAPRELPREWVRFRSMDWGSARPFSVGWWAVSDGAVTGIPRGALVRYREWYGMPPGQPNVGLKLTAEEVADGIKSRETGDRISYGAADPAIFSEDGGPSIAERMSRRGVHWNRADNARVARNGAMGGWDQVRARLKGEDGKPMLLMFSTCRDLIRTLPAMQHDDLRAEDVNTDGEDHAVDDCFVAGTLIQTANGAVPIERVRQGDMVETRRGLRRVTAAFSVGERFVFTVRFSDGATITGTENHPFFVEGRGFVALRDLSYDDVMRTWSANVALAAPRSGPIASRISGIARWLAQALAATRERLFTRSAWAAAPRFPQGTGERFGARVVVGKHPVAGLRRVFNLSVEGEEEYFANGVLVHNCRYACMSRPWMPAVKSSEKPLDRYVRKPTRSTGTGWAA